MGALQGIGTFLLSSNVSGFVIREWFLWIIWERERERQTDRQRDRERRERKRRDRESRERERERAKHVFLALRPHWEDVYEHTCPWGGPLPLTRSGTQQWRFAQTPWGLSSFQLAEWGREHGEELYGRCSRAHLAGASYQFCLDCIG